MSQQPKGATVNESVERMIAEYLRKHPDFFNRHLSSLEHINVPHPCRPAVSLVERQLMLLRQQNGQLRKKLRDLVKVARDNDCLSKRMQHLNLALIEANGLDNMINAVQTVLRDEFNADFTAFKLTCFGFGPDNAARLDAAQLNAAQLDAAQLDAAGLHPAQRLGVAELGLFTHLFETGRPICGRLTSQQIDYLFADAAPRVESTALVPLTMGFDWKGLVAIGSCDPKRFHPGMGTLFLSRIGELISHALHVHTQTPAAFSPSAAPAT